MIEALALLALAGCLALLSVGWRILWKTIGLSARPVSKDSKLHVLTIVLIAGLSGCVALAAGTYLTFRFVCKLLTLL